MSRDTDINTHEKPTSVVLFDIWHAVDDLEHRDAQALHSMIKVLIHLTI